jgi:glycosyltransferase involved in cell wall biosynthesis
MILSILIATIKERVDAFNLLKDHVEKQIGNNKKVELICWSDNKEMSIGKKRQLLLEAAKGEYVVFIDDDDWVSDDYVKSILLALESNPDCVGFDILCTVNGQDKQLARASKKYMWNDNVDGFRYVRHTYHKTPVRRSIALKAGFEDVRYGEDYPYSMRLRPFLKTEVLIEKILYFYQYTTGQTHKERYGIR